MSANNSLIVQIRRGTTAQTASYTGPLAELIVDTDKKTISVQDGVTSGGIYLARQDFAQAAFNAANSAGSSAFTQAAFNQANSANVLAQSSFNQANSANVLAQAAFNAANSAGSSAFTQAAFNQANSANILAQSAYNQANSEPIGTSAYTQANSANVLAQSSFDQANSANVLAQAAFNKANTGGSGYLPNSIIFADSTGTFANTGNLQFYTSNNTLVTANANVSSAIFVSYGASKGLVDIAKIALAQSFIV